MAYCPKHGNYIGINCPKCAAGPRPVVQPARLPVAPKVAVPNPVQVKVPTIHFDKIPLVKVAPPRKSDWDTYFSPNYSGSNPAMEKIKALLADYWRVFSPIARSNFNPYLRGKLTDLQKEVSTWMGSKKLNDPLIPAMVALKEVVDKTLKAMPVPLPGRYHFVVCIGYKVKTDKLVMVKGKYTPVYEGAWGDRVDLYNKRDKLKKAIEQAFTEYKQLYLSGKVPKLSPQQDEDTLKIFMAPEFYFCGKQGAYDMDTVDQILPEMREVTKADAYKNWLFVLGTAIGATRLNTECPTCHGQTELISDPTDPLKHKTIVWCGKCKAKDPRMPKMMLDNFAIIQKGGTKTDENSFLIQKEFMSGVDYSRPDPTTAWDSKNPTPADRQVEVRGLIAEAIPSAGSSQEGSVAPPKYNDERMGGSVFTMDGITFGVEVCRDHLFGRLKTSNDKNALKVQIQLIPSAGAALKEDNIVAPIAFNVDGGDLNWNVAVKKNRHQDAPLTDKGDLFISEWMPILP